MGMIRLAAALLLTLGLAVPAAASCRAPSDAEQMAQNVGQMVNAERQRRGLRPLEYSNGLARVAGRHACDMVQRNYFSHVSPSGTTPMRRVKAEGVCTRATAENIAMGYTSPDRAFQALVDSRKHYENMMSNRVNSVGIAVVEPQPGQGGGRRWVMVLANRC
jgi:uncharacterized protein YkwD